MCRKLDLVTFTEEILMENLILCAVLTVWCTTSDQSLQQYILTFFSVNFDCFKTLK